jgi:hypothetical protein
MCMVRGYIIHGPALALWSALSVRYYHSVHTYIMYTINKLARTRSGTYVYVQGLTQDVQSHFVEYYSTLQLRQSAPQGRSMWRF